MKKRDTKTRTLESNLANPCVHKEETSTTPSLLFHPTLTKKRRRRLATPSPHLVKRNVPGQEGIIEI